MAQIHKGVFIEFDNKAEAHAYVNARAHLTKFKFSKIYGLEDDWWIVSFDIVKHSDENETNISSIDWSIVFDNLSKAELGNSKPEILKGKRQEEVQLGGSYLGVVFRDCPMSNRDALPFYIRPFSYKYKFVLLVLAASTLEFKCMITHETFLMKSFICAFNGDGSHSNYGPVEKNITKSDFLRLAKRISEEMLT